METKRVLFCGTDAEVEAMVRMADKIFRKLWNVYGGKREASWHENGEYKVVMSYTAVFTRYDVYDITELAWRKLCRANLVTEGTYTQEVA